MTQEFNRQKLLENVSALIQARGLRIGEVESAVGISAGYLSRLSKKDSDAPLSVDLIWKLAKQLNVSVDALIEGDFSVATDNTEYFGKFLSRLEMMINFNLQEWQVISQAAVDEIICGNGEELPIVVDCDDTKAIGNRKYGYILPQDREAFEEQHSWVDEVLQEWKDGKHWCWNHRRVYSHFYPDDKAWLIGPGFKFVLDEETSMYLFKMMFEVVDVDSPKNDDGLLNASTFSGYEILFDKLELPEEYASDNYPHDLEDYIWKTYSICNTGTNGKNLSGKVDRLYWTVMRHENDLKIDKTVRASIDSYMKLNDGVPF